MQAPTPSAALTASEADSEALIAQLAALRAQPAAEPARCHHLQIELELRNTALNAAQSHFVIMNFTPPQSHIVYLNRSMAHDYGYEPAELLGKDPRELLPAELNAAQFQRMNN